MILDAGNRTLVERRSLSVGSQRFQWWSALTRRSRTSETNWAVDSTASGTSGRQISRRNKRAEFPAICLFSWAIILWLIFLSGLKGLNQLLQTVGYTNSLYFLYSCLSFDFHYFVDAFVLLVFLPAHFAVTAGFLQGGAFRLSAVSCNATRSFSLNLIVCICFLETRVELQLMEICWECCWWVLLINWCWASQF